MRRRVYPTSWRPIGWAGARARGPARSPHVAFQVDFSVLWGHSKPLWVWVLAEEVDGIRRYRRLSAHGRFGAGDAGGRVDDGMGRPEGAPPSGGLCGRADRTITVDASERGPVVGSGSRSVQGGTYG